MKDLILKNNTKLLLSLSENLFVLTDMILEDQWLKDLKNKEAKNDNL